MLESLARQTVAQRTIVVDNGSPGAAVTHACADYEFAEPVRFERNLGFSRAVNIAAERAAGDTIVLVNDDATYDREFVERLTCALDPDEGVMMAAAVLRSHQNEELIDTAGIEIDRTLLAFDYLNGEPLTVLDAGVSDPLGPSGVGAAFDRRAFAELGGFDELIFAYFEDVDLALRMQLAGWRCRLAPDARGTHMHASTLGSGSRAKNYLMGFARGYLLRKWSVLTPARAPAVIAAELAICAGQALIDRNTSGLRGRRDGWACARRGGAYPHALVANRATLSLPASLMRRARRRGQSRR